jgi:nucleotide-binding universal stress UspA family protein
MVRQASGGGRIVVGIDSSPASAAAVRWAAAEAHLRGMRLHVVHVRDKHAVLPAPYAPLSAGQDTAERAAQESAVQAMVREAAGPATCPAVELELADGLPSRVLIDRAAGAAMLVLGSTRAGSVTDAPVGKPRAPLGPVARDCLRADPCPVVIVGGSGPARESAGPAPDRGRPPWAEAGSPGTSGAGGTL